jgi:hypothetical protein
MYTWQKIISAWFEKRSPNKMNDISIVICTEKGPLEAMARLLVSSLRKFGGSLKDLPVYSYSPRKGLQPGADTKRYFERSDVTIIDHELNSGFSGYALANKIFASYHAEKHLKSDILVFLDTDSFILSDPEQFRLPPGVDARLRPVDSKNVGAEGESDRNFEYWRRIYEITGVREYTYVTTSIDRRRILSYWNGGHIVVRRDKGIFQKWEENFQRVMKNNLQPDDGIFFVEQTALAATISGGNYRVGQLSPWYNYPIHLHDKIPDPEKKAGSIDELVSVHYHKIFHDGHAKKILPPLLDLRGEKSLWLVKTLIDLGMLKDGDIPLPVKKWRLF